MRGVVPFGPPDDVARVPEPRHDPLPASPSWRRRSDRSAGASAARCRCRRRSAHLVERVIEVAGPVEARRSPAPSRASFPRRRSPRASVPRTPRPAAGASPAGCDSDRRRGASGSHSMRGTTLNIAPPSSRNGPSCRTRICMSPTASGPPTSSRARVTHHLLQLDQHAVRGVRVDERHQRPAGADARRLVHQPHAARGRDAPMPRGCRRRAA